MKVLVTGASGLIGSAVTARLSAEGHEVTALVRSKASPVPPAVHITGAAALFEACERQGIRRVVHF